MRKRTGLPHSVTVRAATPQPPDLSNPALIRSGAGNYDALCVRCHLSPGAQETELSAGLYPRPPRWDVLGKVDPHTAFWVLKHGIKASGMPAWGMPAWGRRMDDRYLWGMVAFLQQFPRLDAVQYRAQVQASQGHSHGGGETDVGGGDAQAGHHAKDAPRSSFEPVDDPMAMPAAGAHADGDHKHGCITLRHCASSLREISTMLLMTALALALALTEPQARARGGPRHSGERKIFVMYGLLHGSPRHGESGVTAAKPAPATSPASAQHRAELVDEHRFAPACPQGRQRSQRQQHGGEPHTAPAACSHGVDSAGRSVACAGTVSSRVAQLSAAASRPSAMLAIQIGP